MVYTELSRKSWYFERDAFLIGNDPFTNTLYDVRKELENSQALNSGILLLDAESYSKGSLQMNATVIHSSISNTIYGIRLKESNLGVCFAAIRSLRRTL